MAPAASWILLARLLRPQGRKGEVLADLFTSNTDQFRDRSQVWLAPAGFSERSLPASAEPRVIEIRESWLPVGRNAGRIVLHLAGVDSINQAQTLAGCEIVIPATERPELEPGTVYISELIGATVFHGDQPLGTVEDVQFPTTPDGSRRLEDAAPLLVLHSGTSQELLIPFVQQYIREMDLAQGRLRMELPPGLADLNRKDGPQAPGEPTGDPD